MNYLNLLSLLGIGGAHPGGIILTKKIFESEQFPLDSTILDAGCGTGQTTSYLHQLGYQITGLDIDSQMIVHAENRNLNLNIDIPYMNEDLSNTTVPKDTYDLILCESVLNFTSLPHTLPEISRILKPGGIVVAIEMIRNAPLTIEEELELTTFYGCEHIYSISEWNNLFTEYELPIYKHLSQIDLTFDDDSEPTTEFTPIKSIPDHAFILLSEHERLTLKYANKLSYCVFFARKKLNI